jgi:hypothetical protein
MPTDTSTEVFSYSRAVANVNFPPPIDVAPAEDRMTAYGLNEELARALAPESGKA